MNRAVTLRTDDITVIKVSDDTVKVVSSPLDVIVSVGSTSAGPVGPQGAAGTQGTAGAQGTQGVTGPQGTSPFTVNTIDLTAANSTSTPLTVSGVAAQTADLIQWRNSSGTVAGQISGGGMVKVNGGSGSEISMYADGGGALMMFGTTDGSDRYARMGAFDSAFTIQANARATRYVRSDNGVVMQVRGVLGQSANVQEWLQSDGTVLASVTAAGEVRATLIDGGTA